MYKLIIFDLGGVIIDYSELEYYAYLGSKYNIPIGRVKRIMAPLAEKLEASSITQKALEREASTAFGIPYCDLEWSAAFERLTSINLQVKKLVQRLRRKYRVVLLSNISRSRYIVASTKYFRPSMFDKVFASYALQMRKPEARAFRYVLRKMHVKASEALFIDNQSDNIAGARKVGIRSILFTNYKTLETALRRMNVI